MLNGPLIIGGPSRCGKTTLINILNSDVQNKFAGLPVEGLLKLYANNRSINSLEKQKLFLNEYLRIKYIKS